MAETNGNGNGNGEGVRYSVKELLLGIRQDIANVSAKMDLKADKATVSALESRIVHLEDPNRMTLYGRQLLDQFQGVLKDVADLKSQSVNRDTIEQYKASQRTHRNWLVGLGISNAFTLIGAIAQFLSSR